MEYYYIEQKDLMIIVFSQTINDEHIRDIAEKMITNVKDSGIEHVMVLRGQFEIIK